MQKLYANVEIVDLNLPHRNIKGSSSAGAASMQQTIDIPEVVTAPLPLQLIQTAFSK